MAAAPDLERKRKVTGGYDLLVVRADLQRRAVPLLFRIHEQNLKRFALRLNVSESWYEALGCAVVGKPPSRWLASDVGFGARGLMNLPRRSFASRRRHSRPVLKPAKRFACR